MNVRIMPMNKYEKAYNIIEKYFSEEEAIESTGLEPQQAGDSFGFGQPAPQQPGGFQF